VPALPSSVLEPLWVQVAALLPARQIHHPLGCHRPRIPDRIVFDKLIQILVFGCGYRRIADHTCSATTLRRRRGEWITAGSPTSCACSCWPPMTSYSAWN
jgi:transposase